MSQPVSERLSRPDSAERGAPETLAPLFAPGETPSLPAWTQRRAELLRRWQDLLGRPSFGEYDRAAEVVGAVDQPTWHGTLYRQPTGPDTRQLVLLMEPRQPALQPRPGAVVPFYHPDAMAGLDLSTGEPLTERPVTQFGRHLVEQGYVVVCPEAFPFNTVPEPAENAGFAWWQAAADHLRATQPQWAGIAKLAWDTSRAVDLLLAQPDVDASRIVAMGHSLGGKMAFYTAAFDERIAAIIGSDFGLGWSFTNWDAPWYLGERIAQPGFDLAHHQLLALLAPRAFLLLGGEADRPASWQYLQAAALVYRLHGRELALGFHHHGAGHAPTEESLRLAYAWLAEQFAR